VRPKPFEPVPLDGDPRFVRDAQTGLVWHRVSHRPLYADTDRSQVVYHANYLRFFELGRATLMRDVGYPYKEVEESGFVYPIVELGMTFHAPLRYDDPMWVHTRPVEVERIKILFDYLITAAGSGKIVCLGFTRHCSLGPSGKPAPVDPLTQKMWRGFPR
jgi:acyl-CoA thioester hydrolase